jgi:hypothetical protein
MADQIEFLGRRPASMRERARTLRQIARATSLVTERKQMLVLAKQLEEEATRRRNMACSRRQTLRSDDGGADARRLCVQALSVRDVRTSAGMIYRSAIPLCVMLLI